MIELFLCVFIVVDLEINRKANKKILKMQFLSRFDHEIWVFVFYCGTTFISIFLAEILFTFFLCKKKYYPCFISCTGFIILFFKDLFSTWKLYRSAQVQEMLILTLIWSCIWNETWVAGQFSLKDRDLRSEMLFFSSQYYKQVFSAFVDVFLSNWPCWLRIVCFNVFFGFFNKFNTFVLIFVCVQAIISFTLYSKSFLTLLIKHG